MVFWVSPNQLAGDVAAGVKWVEKLGSDGMGDREEGKGKVVLLAHSNGGGLAQWALDRGMCKVGALVLMAGTPCFGQ